MAPGRCLKQAAHPTSLPTPNCRGNWLADEEFHLALCHTLVGNQWSQHCNRLRGRTENSIKNYWNATLRSKQPNKRRGFLWAYIDRVKGALDDEALRHRAFADTVGGLLHVVGPRTEARACNALQLAKTVGGEGA